MRCFTCGQEKSWWRKHVCREAVLMVSKPIFKGKRNLRVSELEQIERPSTDDVLLIVDTSEQVSKKITMAQLKAFIKS